MHAREKGAGCGWALANGECDVDPSWEQIGQRSQHELHVIGEDAVCLLAKSALQAAIAHDDA
eukprot:2916995-Prymnesium_polylepis.1